MNTFTKLKKDGGTVKKVIQAVLWEGNGVALCALAVDAPATSVRRSSRYVPCGYPGCSPGYCDECDGEGRYS